MPTYTKKEAAVLANLKSEASKLFAQALEVDGMPADTKFANFSAENMSAALYNTTMGMYFDAIKTFAKNAKRREAQRARRAAYAACGMVRVKDSAGREIYE